MVEPIHLNLNSSNPQINPEIEDSFKTFITLSESIIKKLSSQDISNNKKSAFDSLPELLQKLRFTLVDPINSSLNIILIGLTDSGKSTLGSALVGDDYFPASNQEDTYCPNVLFDAIMDVDPSYKVLTIGEKEKSEEKYFFEKKGLLDEINRLRILNIKAINEEDIPKRIQIYVKGLSKENDLPQGVIINDGPGINEITSKKLKEELMNKWTNSIVIVTMDLNSKTTNIGLISEILNVFCENKATSKIIFVFTKVLSHILSCESKKNKRVNSNEIAQKAIEEANKTLCKFESEIKGKYPEARCLLYEQNADKCQDYYYYKEQLQYKYKPRSNEMNNVINVGKESIDYLKVIIKKSAEDVKNYMRNSTQLERERLIVEFIQTLYDITSDSYFIFKRINQFKNDLNDLIPRIKNDFKPIIDNYIYKPSFTRLPLHLNPYIQQGDSLLKRDIAHAIIEIQNSIEKRIWLKTIYQQYLLRNFPLKFKQIICSRFNNGLRSRFINSKIEYSEIFKKYIELANEDIFILEGNFHLLNGNIHGLSTLRLLGYFMIFMLDCAALLKFGKVIGFGIGLGFTGFYMLAWTRKACNNDIIEWIYDLLKEKNDFAKRLLSSIDECFQKIYTELLEKAQILFTPSNVDIPGFPEYKELILIQEQLQRKAKVNDMEKIKL